MATPLIYATCPHQDRLEHHGVARHPVAARDGIPAGLHSFAARHEHRGYAECDEDGVWRAVELYESTPGATVKGTAADLGVERATLQLWLDKFGTGTRTDPDGSRSRRASRATQARHVRPQPGRES